MVVIVGSEVVLIVNLSWVTLVAYGAVEEADGVGDGIVAWRHVDGCGAGFLSAKARRLMLEAVLMYFDSIQGA
jgi:hypothetical protein